MILFLRRDFIFISTLLFATALYAADPLPKIPTVDQAIRLAAKDAPLRWQFAGNTPEDLVSWQKKFRSQLSKLLGPHTPPSTFSTERIKKSKYKIKSKIYFDEIKRKQKTFPSCVLYTLN